MPKKPVRIFSYFRYFRLRYLEKTRIITVIFIQLVNQYVGQQSCSRQLLFSTQGHDEIDQTNNLITEFLLSELKQTRQRTSFNRTILV